MPYAAASLGCVHSLTTPQVAPGLSQCLMPNPCICGFLAVARSLRLSVVFRTCVLPHHTPQAPTPWVLQRWLSQPRQRAQCWRYLGQGRCSACRRWCSFSFIRVNTRGFDFSRIGLLNTPPDFSRSSASRVASSFQGVSSVAHRLVAVPSPYGRLHPRVFGEKGEKESW